MISEVAHHFCGANWRPDWVELPNTRKSDIKELDALTGTVIRTDYDIPSIAIRVSELSTPNPGLPKSAKPLPLGELGALMGIAPAQTTVEAIEQMLETSLAADVPNEGRVFRSLAISQRTLQRAL